MLRDILLALIGWVRSRRELVLENLALRQQLAALGARKPRPRLAVHDRLFWFILRRFWSDWRRTLVIVQPETGDARCRAQSLQQSSWPLLLMASLPTRFYEAGP